MRNDTKFVWENVPHIKEKDFHFEGWEDRTPAIMELLEDQNKALNIMIDILVEIRNRL